MDCILGNENDFSTFLMILDTLNFFNFKLNIQAEDIDSLFNEGPSPEEFLFY